MTPASHGDVVVSSRVRAEGERTGTSLGRWGLLALIANETVLFGLLLFAYLQLRAQSAQWPLGGIAEPELVRSGLRTVVLLASSLPIHMAGRAVEEGDQAKLRWTLAIGGLMGALFLVGHLDEWSTMLDEFTPATNAYGSIVFTITGLHALHLAVGLVVVAYLWAGAMSGRYDADHPGGVPNGVLYWHFVDLVWVFVYATLYLSVRFT